MHTGRVAPVSPRATRSYPPFPPFTCRSPSHFNLINPADVGQDAADPQQQRPHFFFRGLVEGHPKGPVTHYPRPPRSHSHGACGREPGGRPRLHPTVDHRISAHMASSCRRWCGCRCLTRRPPIRRERHPPWGGSGSCHAALPATGQAARRPGQARPTPLPNGEAGGGHSMKKHPRRATAAAPPVRHCRLIGVAGGGGRAFPRPWKCRQRGSAPCRQRCHERRRRATGECRLRGAHPPPLVTPPPVWARPAHTRPG